MVALDISSILNEVVALSIVLAPLEFFILRNVIVFRSTFDKLRSRLDDWLVVLGTKEGRASVISELGHGLLRAVTEKAGSLKGAEMRQQNAGLLEMVKGGGAGALAALPGKIELPVIGKVTIGEAISIAQAIGSLMKGGGSNPLAALMQGTSTTGAGYPK